MAKRQAVPAGSKFVIPPDLVAFCKQPSDAYDSFIRLTPSQTSPLTVTTSEVRLQMEIPNTKSLRLNNIMAEMDLTPGFTSTDGDDKFADVKPQFVPLIPSIISRVTVNIGSTTLLDIYGNDLRWNLQYWLKSNSITRLNDLYLYPTTALAPTTQVATTVRFPLTFAENDLLSLKNGFLPTGKMQKMVIDIYFSPAANCMVHDGGEGTITLNYTVSNFVLKVEDMGSGTIARALSAQPLRFSYTEWYYQYAPLTGSPSSMSLLIPNNFRYVQSVIAVIRKVSDITDITKATKLKEFTSDMSPITKANVRLQGQLRYNEPLSSTIDMMHEIKKVWPPAASCDYFQNLTTNGTTHNVIALRVGRSISPGVESGVNSSSWTAPATMEVTWTSPLTSANYQVDFFTLHTRYVTIGVNGQFMIEE